MRAHIGQKVWFYTVGHQMNQQPFSGTVVHVIDDNCVNLAVDDQVGNRSGICNVPFIDGESGRQAPRDGSHWCCPPTMGGEGVGLAPGVRPDL